MKLQEDRVDDGTFDAHKVKDESGLFRRGSSQRFETRRVSSVWFDTKTRIRFPQVPRCEGLRLPQCSTLQDFSIPSLGDAVRFRPFNFPCEKANVGSAEKTRKTGLFALIGFGPTVIITSDARMVLVVEYIQAGKSSDPGTYHRVAGPLSTAAICFGEREFLFYLLSP